MKVKNAGEGSSQQKGGSAGNAGSSGVTPKRSKVVKIKSAEPTPRKPKKPKEHKPGPVPTTPHPVIGVPVGNLRVRIGSQIREGPSEDLRRELADETIVPEEPAPRGRPRKKLETAPHVRPGVSTRQGGQHNVQYDLQGYVHVTADDECREATTREATTREATKREEAAGPSQPKRGRGRPRKNK